ncbi:MAG: phosphoribosylformylglycinamidine synthase subunit PurS [Hyphomicrobiales bacterium]
MKAKITITLKHSVLDPQGKAIGHALHALGFKGVDEVRHGKYIELDVEESDEERARMKVEAMCGDLLANTLIEDYTIELAR